MINYIIALLIAILAFFAGKKVLQSVENGGCPGCSGNCGCGGSCGGSCHGNGSKKAV